MVEFACGHYVQRGQIRVWVSEFGWCRSPKLRSTKSAAAVRSYNTLAKFYLPTSSYYTRHRDRGLMPLTSQMRRKNGQGVAR